MLPEALRSDWVRTWPGGFYPNSKELAEVQGRIAMMDRYGVEMLVLSMTAAGPQGEPDLATSIDMARRANEVMAREVSRRPDRFAAFACLSMQDVDVACRELERAVKEMGMRGALLNNGQRHLADPDALLFYDLPRYDAFWATAARLEAPIYLHPSLPTPGRAKDVVAAPWVNAAVWEYSVGAGSHALRIITSGVFDRHPGAQLILGHNGEHIVGDMWRIDNRIAKDPRGYLAKRTVRSYFGTNVHITTSGQFTTPYLKQCIAEIGADRIMFSIDTPYEEISTGAGWFRDADIPEAQRATIGRGNAVKLLKLPL